MSTCKLSNIEIQRYDDGVKGWSGCIQDQDETWIIFLDEGGRPKLFWGDRDEMGGVIGEPLSL